MKHLFLIPLVAVALSFQGCDKIKAVYKASTYQTSTATSDQILIRSEQLTKQALYTFDLFLSIERNNEKALKDLNPEIHLVAEKVRSHGKEWIVAARNATKTFKANRTSANAANMQTAYLTLNGLYNEVKSAQAKADTLNNKTP